ncbi:MAG: hypothetical protein EBS72_15910, partial [Rhizobiales bacterium]|nr:hypothetical protein [Hyphomicrobiales bacterium]
MNFNETLGSTTVMPGYFSVMSGGQSVGVSSVSISGSQAVLNLSGSIAPGAAVTVSYTDPSGANDASGVLQDMAGNDVVNFGGVTAQNNSGQSGGGTGDTTAPTLLSSGGAVVSTSGTSLILNFNETLGST